MSNVFYADPYTKEIDTVIKSAFVEDDKNCVQIMDNIFHPHGGGQKGDRGVIIIEGKTINVVDTIKDKYSSEDILLITQEEVSEEAVNKPVSCKLDWSFRHKQMRLHTAVHLHHCMLEKVMGKSIRPPKTSDIEEDFAFNRYESKEITPEVVEKGNAAFREAVSMGADVKTFPDPEKKGFRWWECLGYKIPCGGTHVSNISEIGEVDIEYSKKKGQPTINIKLK
jgi:alanyl-tRNA synthetase/misacylated tRNA(Ala) deacylase